MSIHRAGPSWDSEVNKLRKMGASLPNSPSQARAEAMNMQAAVNNRTLTSSMNRQRMASYRGRQFMGSGSNMQITLPKVRQPLGTLTDKGIPFNVEDEDELRTIRTWCNTPDAPVWMADYTFKNIGDIEPGEQVIGWETNPDVWGSGRRELTKTTVLAVNRRVAPEVVLITFASGRTVKCTPDHEWLRYYVPGPDGRITNGPEKHLGGRDGKNFKVHTSEYAPLRVGSIARSVVKPTQDLDSVEKIKAASWLAGIIDGEGSWTKRTIRISQSPKHNPHIVERIDQALDLLGMTYTRYLREKGSAAEGSGHLGGAMVIWDICQGRSNHGDKTGKNRQQLIDLYNWAKPAKMDAEHMDAAFLSRNFGEPEEVVSIESLGPGEVVSMQTTTGNYTAWGIASKNCRLFYATHDLVPLLIDIYSKFPVVGLEFDSKDTGIKRFYEDMFLGDLNYLEFLPDQMGKEYFTVGEVTSLAHFSESLGVWSSEEILNPDMLRVSRSLFVQQDRVQLMVKEMVDNLRSGPDGGMSRNEETPSERDQRNREFAELARCYPEIIEAAAKDDGLDISDALVSRIVNRNTPWATRGTPHLLRSFRTLMTEESLMAAQDAVADRLYSPLVLATLGIEDMGDGEPWIPDQSELDDARDDLQSALAADFRLMVHNFGLKVENVFGRESVPNLDGDFDRVQSKLLQAWGIGAALISGGDGGAYASSALNREFVTQMMVGFQNAVKRHIIKRAEVIAEAQGHYDYDLKGGVRVPIYREIVEVDPETGEEYIRKVPKLLIPDVKFSTLNLRDEAQERAFISQLKSMGVPVSDKTLAVNIDMEFDQELERQAEESVAKLMATAQAMKKVQDLCDNQNLPYPPELAQHLMSTLQLRQGKTQTELGEAQAVAGEAQAGLQTEQVEMQKAMMEQQMAGAGMAAQGAPGGPPPTGPDPMPPGPEEAQAQAEGGGEMEAPAQGPNVSPLSAQGPGAPGPGNPPAGVYASLNLVNGPMGSAPVGSPPSGGVGPELPPGVPEPTEIPRNRQRPAESDTMRGNEPKQVGASRRKRTRKGEQVERRPSKFETGPSSYGRSHTASEEDVTNQVRRLETVASWDFQPGRHPKVSDLVKDPKFYRALNMGSYRGQLQADWPEILAGGATDSKRILDDMLAQFVEIFGVEPVW